MKKHTGNMFVCVIIWVLGFSSYHSAVLYTWYRKQSTKLCTCIISYYVIIEHSV